MKFKTVIFDFDSTISSIEGIDELARLHGKYEAVSDLTRQAMSGKLRFEEVFFKRLQIIKPTIESLEQVEKLYRDNLVLGVKEAIEVLRRSGKKVMIVTGGYKQAIMPVAKSLGFKEDDVWAIELVADKKGYLTKAKLNHLEPTDDGKKNLVEWLKPQRKVAFVGDGANDVQIKSVVDLFIGFGGVAFRRTVKSKSDYYIAQKSILPVLDIIKKEESKYA